jgi:hypothetical protein
MSSATQIAAPVLAPLERSLIDRGRHLGGPVALVLGGVLGLVGMTLHPKGGTPDVALMRDIAAHSSQWLASHLLMGFGWALVAAGMMTVLRLAKGRGATLTAVGAVIASMGAGLSAFGDMAHGALAYALVDQVEPAASLAIQEAFFTHPAFAVISFGGMLLPLAILLLGVAMLRSRALPRWAAIVLMLSPFLIQLGFMVTELPFPVLVLPFVVGLAALARAIAGTSAAPAGAVPGEARSAA